MKQLRDMIKVQNETINFLDGVLSSKIKFPTPLKHLLSEKEKDDKIKSLTEQLNQLQDQLNMYNKDRSTFIKSVTSSGSAISKFLSSSVHWENDPLSSENVLHSSNFSTSFLIPKKEGLDKECSARYGQ